jgi:hypothetical protein
MGGREVLKGWEGGRIGRIFSPVLNLHLQLYCFSYSGDYRTERLVHSITVVPHVG